MLGFSIQKLLFTVAVVVAVWYGFKWVGRMKQIRDKEAKDRLRRDAQGGNKGGNGGGPSGGPSVDSPSDAHGDAEEMVECAVCGAFVAVRGAKSCGRDDCPYQG